MNRCCRVSHTNITLYDTTASEYLPAIIPVITGNNKTKANILFDKEDQCSFKSTGMVKELATSTTDISVASFGSISRSHQKLGVATVTITRE